MDVVQQVACAVASTGLRCASMDLEAERWRQDMLAKRHPVIRAIDNCACFVSDWCADHAALAWGILLLVLAIALYVIR